MLHESKGNKKHTTTQISVVNYTESGSQENSGTKLEELLPANELPGITWINVEGLKDKQVIEQLAKHYNLHPLTTEDILNVEQRPKVEEYDHYIYITLKVLYWQDKSKLFHTKQLSIVLSKNFVLTFQEWDTTLFDDIRARLQSGIKQRFRELGSDYLVYRLIDQIIDDYFVVLESLGDKIESIEGRIISSTKIQTSRMIYNLKRQLLLLRKSVWPMREAMGHLMHVQGSLITSSTVLYFRDVYDHIVQAIDTIETYRDMLSSMLDMHLSSLTNRMNEIMKTLTIITTIFIPITSLASIYGMNFQYIPGLHAIYGFDIVIVTMIIMAILMVIYFKAKKWF